MINEISTVFRPEAKNPIDSAGFSGYNVSEVIYLWGMALAFPIIQKEVYGYLWIRK